MKIYYNPLETSCKSKIGAAAQESIITLNLYERQGGEESFFIKSCLLVINHDGEQAQELLMQKKESRWTISLKFHAKGLYFYHFRINGQIFSCGQMRNGTFTQEPNCWQITIYDKKFKTPAWLKGGVMYQIFPDRFCKKGDIPQLSSNKIPRNWGETPNYSPDEHGRILNHDFFGGNLNGIREKLGYLKELGITTIYLNPIFEAFSNHRYDTGDFFKIDPVLGTEEDLKSLIQEAEILGIRILLDGVFNHVGADSRYFNRYGTYSDLGAYQSKESPYYSWFQFFNYPDEYDSWWGISSLPAINESDPSYQKFLFNEQGVLSHWLQCGIAGFRIDVADELPDYFLKKLRKNVKSFKNDAILIGEVWEDASNKISYHVRREYFQGEELDSVMNYPLKNAIIDFMITGKCQSLRETIAMLIDHYPPDSLNILMNILGTHDTARILTVLSGKKYADREAKAHQKLSEQEKFQAKELLKSAALLQYTLPGVPCLYYGDENGMEGYEDPFCRRCFDWEHLDHDLIEYYQLLGRLRSENRNVFAEGFYHEIFSDSGCLVYERKYEFESVMVYVNRSESQYKINFSENYCDLFTGIVYNDVFSISPHSYGILKKLR